MGKYLLLSQQGFGDELKKMIENSDPKIGYVPSQSDFGRDYFKAEVNYYQKLGFNKFMYFDIDKEYNPNKLDELMECDIIHIAGGRETYFLKNFLSRNFDKFIREYSNNEGIIVAICSGAGILSQDIIFSSIYGKQTITLATLHYGLGLVDFVLHTVWDEEKMDFKSIIEYCIKEKRTIYLCHKDDGIIVDKSNIKLLGDVVKLENNYIFRKHQAPKLFSDFYD